MTRAKGRSQARLDRRWGFGVILLTGIGFFSLLFFAPEFLLLAAFLLFLLFMAVC